MRAPFLVLAAPCWLGAAQKTTNQPRSADFFLRQILPEKQRIHSFFDHPMGQKGPSAYILHPSASILYPADYIFVVLNVILEHFGRPLALPLFCYYSRIFLLFSALKPFWHPYATLMVPYGTLMVPYGTTKTTLFK